MDEDNKPWPEQKRIRTELAMAIGKDASMEARECIHKLLKEREELEEENERLRSLFTDDS